MGTHGAWLGEASGGVRVLLDGEPGFNQMKMEKRRSAGERLAEYDYYYTAGSNIGTLAAAPPRRQGSTGVTCGIRSSPSCYQSCRSALMRRSRRS